MNPHDPAFSPAFFIVGVPLIVLTGGPYGWRFLTLLGALAALAYAPLLGIAASCSTCSAPIRWALEGFIFGLAGGIGARLSGIFSGPERAERQRERWQARRERGRGDEYDTYNFGHDRLA